MALVTPRLREDTDPAVEVGLNDSPHTTQNPSASASEIFELPWWIFDGPADDSGASLREERDGVAEPIAELSHTDNLGRIEQHVGFIREKHSREEYNILKGLHVSGDGEVVGNETNCIGRLTYGNVYDIMGCPIGDYGEIRNSNGDLIGLVDLVDPVFDTRDGVSLSDMDRLCGLTCGLDGLIYDANRQLLGIATEGQPEELQHALLDDHGQFLNQFDEIIGKAVIHPEASLSVGAHMPDTPLDQESPQLEWSEFSTKAVLFDLYQEERLQMQTTEFTDLSNETRDSLAKRVCFSNQHAASGHKAICVIESINEEWANFLQHIWNVPQGFAHLHYYRPPKEPNQPEFLYGHCRAVAETYGSIYACMELCNNVRQIGSWLDPEGYFVDCTDGYDRRLEPWRTRISYYWVNRSLLVLLVDEPFDTEFLGGHFPPIRPYLRFPDPKVPARTVKLPQLFGTFTYSILEMLTRSFSESDLLAGVFAASDPCHGFPTDFLLLLTQAICELNLQRLEDDITRISFVKIRDPDTTTSDELHDRREDLYYLRSAVRGIRDCIGEEGVEAFPRSKWSLQMLEKNENLKTGLSSAEKILMDTFQLLISSLSARDSHTSLQQSRRGTLVTALAFIYIPLSFVTGIFGMNLKSVNGSPLPFWVCFVALAVVMAATGIIFGSFKWWQYHKGKRQNPGHYKLA